MPNYKSHHAAQSYEPDTILEHEYTHTDRVNSIRLLPFHGKGIQKKKRAVAHMPGSGEPGLVDRVLALLQEAEGFDSSRPGYPHPVSWKIVVSKWRSVTAVSLNVGGGVRLICACARRTLQTQQGRTHSAGCEQQWFRTAEPLGGTSLRELEHTHMPCVPVSNVWVKDLNLLYELFSTWIKAKMNMVSLQRFSC